MNGKIERFANVSDEMIEGWRSVLGQKRSAFSEVVRTTRRGRRLGGLKRAVGK